MSVKIFYGLMVVNVMSVPSLINIDITNTPCLSVLSTYLYISGMCI